MTHINELINWEQISLKLVWKKTIIYFARNTNGNVICKIVVIFLGPHLLMFDLMQET